jgi:hypothetical protein
VKRLVACSLLVMLATGCTADPHSLKITDQNKDSYMESIKDSKGLTVEEIGLLSAYQTRRLAGKALGGTEQSIVGETVGDLIADQRRFQEEEKRLAAEAKAKAGALAADMRNAIELTVVDKGFIPFNATAGRFQDLITFKFAYENKSGKDIRAFTGDVQFTDLLGKEIFTTELTISDPIAAGARSTWDDSIQYSRFDATHQALKNAELASMKVVWLPSQVVFADGSTLGGDSK